MASIFFNEIALTFWVVSVNGYPEIYIAPPSIPIQEIGDFVFHLN